MATKAAIKRTTKPGGGRPNRAAAAATGPPHDAGLIVGIGASAGGLSAFTIFLENMPADNGMAFVLVQHLAPDHKSMLVDILGKVTAMRVVEAEDGVPVAKNTVYIIPPNATLSLQGGKLLVTRPAPPREHRKPIDTFFFSLAEDQGEKAVCIVLSGTGSDGTLGLKAVKDYGGFVMAQAESDHTAMSGMPQSAAATGLVDEVLAVQDMPQKLLDYQRHLSKVAPRKGEDGVRRDTAEHLATISGLLHAQSGHDFSDYKESTLVRRVQRRMQVLQVDDVPAYIARLKKEPQQLDLLFREFLIGVTQFFRDPKAFEALEQTALPSLAAQRPAGEPFRVWAPGCSTGEEVFSIAILLKEVFNRRGDTSRIQLFGTDIDDRAIAVARTGSYRKITGVSAERLERWFVEDGDSYRVVKEIREMCVFSTHSIAKDPPFSKLDLISCRNLLIYLNAGVQDRVLRSFHYGLKPFGILFLGPSEGAARVEAAFAFLDRKHRIFQRRDAHLALPVLSQSATPSQPATPAPPPTGSSEDRIDRGARRALEPYSPVYLVVDQNHEIIRFSGGDAGRYLEPSSGTASLDLFGLLRKALRPAVRSALLTMLATKQAVVSENVALKIDGVSGTVTIVAAPIAGTTLSVVAFQHARLASGAGPAAMDSAAAANAAALEHELRTAKTQLRAMSDELEITTEEMKSAGEEYQSVNEELQSSNEELETAKEEMQSVNEELHIINAEMTTKNETMTLLNNDLKNLLNSTDIATIFLDHNLRIKSFTSGMTKIFHLRDADRGRPIIEIVSMLNYEHLERDVRKVLNELSVVEREVSVAKTSKIFIMRIHPYWTVDNVIDGVVITFIDISDRKYAESTMHASEARYRALFATINEGFCIIEKVKTAPGEPIDFRYISANPAFSTQTGVGDVIGKTFRERFPGESQEWFDIYDTVLRTGQAVKFERALVTQNRVLELFAFRLDDEVCQTVAVIFTDITERKKTEEHTSLLLGELDHRVKNILSIVSAVVRQTLKTSPSPEIFAANIEGRVAAISRAHARLTQTGGQQEVLLHDLIAMEFAPHQNRIKELVIGGADVALSPKAGLAMAMVIHELTNNAVKYGALSSNTGQLTVHWNVMGDAAGSSLKLIWNETGGPAVEPPTRKGFGTTLIERSLTHEFDAQVKREFLPAGLRCTIEFVLTPEIGRLLSRLHEKGTP